MLTFFVFQQIFSLFVVNTNASNDGRSKLHCYELFNATAVEIVSRCLPSSRFALYQSHHKHLSESTFHRDVWCASLRTASPRAEFFRFVLTRVCNRKRNRSPSLAIVD